MSNSFFFQVICVIWVSVAFPRVTLLISDRREGRYLFSSSWTGMGSWDRPWAARTSKLARASWKKRESGCNLAPVSWQNIRATWQEVTEGARKTLNNAFEVAYFSWLMVIAVLPPHRVFYVRLVKSERARMNSLPAYTSITGGGRLGNKPYKSNYVYVSSQVLAMPDNLLWQRKSWPVGFKNAHGIIYIWWGRNADQHMLYGRVSGKGTMDPNCTIGKARWSLWKKKKSTHEVSAQVLVFVIYTWKQTAAQWARSRFKSSQLAGRQVIKTLNFKIGVINLPKCEQRSPILIARCVKTPGSALGCSALDWWVREQIITGEKKKKKLPAPSVHLF